MKWISMKHLFPPKNTKVLCYYFDKYIDIMEYRNDDDQGNPEFWIRLSPPVIGITHWMPLPEKPKFED